MINESPKPSAEAAAGQALAATALLGGFTEHELFIIGCACGTNMSPAEIKKIPESQWRRYYRVGSCFIAKLIARDLLVKRDYRLPPSMEVIFRAAIKKQRDKFMAESPNEKALP